ncbi:MULTISPECIES: C40 family peptidase [Pseudonocardia]|jgi:cell wall-associated NlpC family hydrolase|uniref:Cell wall-associated NlpC family hydrolase n=1 Tax=Pseudonocardia alni TaxID=33907 RepID=A0AA44UMS1_PSEA5|nr:MULTISPECIES: NlpC/P60 family protein [Pseudonocardia]OJG08215.1 putative endopeptidase precursor [Pseudonocardia autotrophica]PKB29960.1 cell wall-associated NlpC family hydrolase [Pseudonocardia alni]
MTTALTPDLHTPESDVPRRRRDRDAGAGISAADLLARYSEAGFDTPAPGSRRARRSEAPGPELERIDTPATGLPAASGGDTVITRDAQDTPAGVTSRTAIGLLGGTSDTGPLGRHPRAVVATMSATLVGATAVMGVVSALSSPEQSPETSADMDLTGAAHEATMKLSVPAAGSEHGGTGTSDAASTLTSGFEHVTASVPQAFEKADAARIAAVAQKEAAAKAAEARAKAAEAAARNGGGGDDDGDGGGLGDIVGGLTGSSDGAQALAQAKQQLGKPYKWGATGPSAFDCSGLMVWAFEQIGVDLPRTSSAQSQMDGTPVSKSQLKPGDMVFFYSPVSHVGIYAGNGKVLHASTSGEPVKYSDIDAMPFHNAVRV